MKPAEIDYNSEDERAPDWLKSQIGYVRYTYFSKFQFLLHWLLRLELALKIVE